MGLVDTFVSLVPTVEVQVPEPDFAGITLSIIEELFSFESVAEDIPTPTPQSVQEVEAHESLTQVFKTAALAAGTDALAKLELDSAEQAQGIIANLAPKFNDVLDSDSLTTDALESLAALKAGTVKHFADLAATLPRIRVVKLLEVEPALIVAYRLQGSTFFADDLIRRNKIRHPAFVPPHVDLEILVPE
jgi:prophage DNA circulation protein